MAGEVSYGKARLGKSGSGYAGFYFKEEIIMVYKFKEGSRINADPQVVGQVCEKLSAEGELTAIAYSKKAETVQLLYIICLNGMTRLQLKNIVFLKHGTLLGQLRLKLRQT